MPEQVALALINGKISQIPATDTIRGASGAPAEVDVWQEVTYSSGIPSYLTYYSSSTFITANRTARNDFSYTGDLLTSEVLKSYDTDGTTILTTYTWTHTYSGDDYISSSMVIT